jgi:hypothetical protein
MTRLYSTRRQVENKSSIIEMSTVASTDDVINGRVKLYLAGFTSQEPVYYDAALYAMHLRNILNMLITNPNYNFYPLEVSDFGEYGSDYCPISIVDGQAVLVTNDTLMLHFVQHDIIRTLYEDIYNQALVRKKYFQSREEVIALLNERLDSIQKSVG